MSDSTFGRSGVHVTSGELALYIIDGLDPERRDAVESHVLACEDCADGLAREARVEAAFGEVARLANERAMAPVISLVPALRAAEMRARVVAGGRRSRWAGGAAGALAAAAAMVLAFSSTTARSEPASVGGMALRGPGMHDAAGDMSGALGGEIAVRDPKDALDGG